MALLITHPDYMIEPERLDAYARFLDVTPGRVRLACTAERGQRLVAQTRRFVDRA